MASYTQRRGQPCPHLTARPHPQPPQATHPPLTPDQDIPLPPRPTVPPSNPMVLTSLLLTNMAACYFSGLAGRSVSLHGQSCIPEQQVQTYSGAQVSVPWLPSCLEWQVGLVCQALGPQRLKLEQNCIELLAFSAHF